MAIIRQRCRNHPEREAAARCSSCGRDYCRECVIPYDGRLTCGACIQKLGKKDAEEKRSAIVSGVILLVGASAGILVMWGCFYLLGRLLLKTPTIFYSNWLGT